MRRDTQEALERMDHILRCERQLRRWLIDPPAEIAEENYDTLHAALVVAEDALSAAYREWHGTSNPASDPFDAGPGGQVTHNVPNQESRPR